MPKEEISLMEEEYPDSGETTGMAKFCQDLYEEYRTSEYRKKKLDEIASGRKRYKGNLDPKTFPWVDCSNHSMMLDTIAIDNLEPRIYAQLIAEEDFISAEPRGPEDVEHKDGAEEFANWMPENMELPVVMRKVVHNLLMDGTVDVIPVWKEHQFTNRIRTVVPVYSDPAGNQIEVPQGVNPQMLQAMGIQQTGFEDSFEEREETVFKCELEIIPLNRAFFPDDGEHFEEKPYIREIFPTLQELDDLNEENGGPYKNISRDLVVDPGRRSNDNPDDDQMEKGIQFSEYQKEVPLVECYFKWGPDWMIASFAHEAGWKEVRKQKLIDVYWHGHKPVKRFAIFPETNESMGTGIPQKIIHFSEGIDDIYNQMIDAGTIEIIPFFFYQDAPGFSQIDMNITPGKGIKVGKGSSVDFPNIAAKAVQHLSFIQAILGFFERVISLSDYTMGRESGHPGKGGETYSGMALIVQEGNVKQQYQGESLRDQFAKLMTDCLSVYAQYMPLDAKRRVFENNEWIFQPLDVMAIQGNYDLKIEISDASANKGLNRKEAVELLGQMAQNPAANIVKLTEDVMKSYGRKNTQEYVNPAFRKVVEAVSQFPQIAQVVDQAMQQLMQQQRDQEIQAEAQSNVRRQSIEREVERPVEDDKILDQAIESEKRQAVKNNVKQLGLYGNG